MTGNIPSSSGNIATSLSFMASRQPTRAAIHCPVGRDAVGAPIYKTLTYAELEHEVGLIASGLIAYGIGPGVRAALMVRPSIELFVLMFALFRAGAVPVLIDPGIDRGALKACLGEAKPEAFIGVPLAHAARVMLGWARSTIKHRVTVNGGRWFSTLSPSLRHDIHRRQREQDLPARCEIRRLPVKDRVPELPDPRE